MWVSLSLLGIILVCIVKNFVSESRELSVEFVVLLLA